MQTVVFVLQVLAVVCFVIAAFWNSLTNTIPPASPRVNFFSLGVAFWALSLVIGGAPHSLR